MPDFSDSRTLVIPTLEQVKSGKIKRPNEIHVVTIWSTLHSEIMKMELHTHWKIDHSYGELHFQRGCISSFLLVEPILPSKTPNRHLRAARRVAAAVFGLKRFNRTVRMYEQFGGETLVLASHKKDRVLLADKDDALLWSLEIQATPEVYEIAIKDALKMFPNKTQQEVIELAQETSMRLKFIALRLELRRTLGQRAQVVLDRITQTSYPQHKIIEMMFDYPEAVSITMESII